MIYISKNVCEAFTKTNPEFPIVTNCLTSDIYLFDEKNIKIDLIGPKICDNLEFFLCVKR